eukprot:476595_1
MAAQVPKHVTVSSVRMQKKKSAKSDATKDVDIPGSFSQQQLLISAKSAMALSKDIVVCGKPVPIVGEWGFDSEAHMELIKKRFLGLWTHSHAATARLSLDDHRARIERVWRAQSTLLANEFKTQLK